jgi:hypothetical protein
VRLFILLCLLQPLFAADAIPLSIGEMSKRADLIVRAKVESKSVMRDEKGRVLTETKLHVSEVWKGDPKQPLLTVVHSGGILGERKIVALGQVKYDVGEELIGFYLWNERGQAITVAMEQGKLRLTKDAVERDGKQVAASDIKAEVQNALK